MYCGAWLIPGAASSCCTCHMCWLQVCTFWCPGVYLVLSVLAVLGILAVCKLGALHAPGASGGRRMF